MVADVEDALTLRELRALAAVLRAVEHLDPEGARSNEYAAGMIERVRVLPTVEPAAPYREKAPPSEALDAETWAEQRRVVAEIVHDDETLLAMVRSVQRDDARAVIFAIAYEAAVHCAITPGEVRFLSLLEQEWHLSTE